MKKFDLPAPNHCVAPYHLSLCTVNARVGRVFGGGRASARFESERMLHAFGIAGSHSAGTIEYDQTGGEIKRVHVGIAARGGIQAVM